MLVHGEREGVKEFGWGELRNGVSTEQTSPEAFQRALQLAGYP